MWVCSTEAGDFWIRFDPLSRKGFLLGIDEEALGSYYSPEAAADDVYLQKSGCGEWDSETPAWKPSDLSEWIRMDCCNRQFVFPDRDSPNRNRRRVSEFEARNARRVSDLED